MFTGFDPETAAGLTAVFDVGGMIGALLAGLISDSCGGPAIMIFISLISGLFPLVSHVVVVWQGSGRDEEEFLQGRPGTGEKWDRGEMK